MCCAGSEEHRLAAKTALVKHTQEVLNSDDEGKDNRADRRRLRLLVSTSTFRSLVFGTTRGDAHNVVDMRYNVV